MEEWYLFPNYLFIFFRPTGSKATSTNLIIPTLAVHNDSLHVLEEALANNIPVTFKAASAKVLTFSWFNLIKYHQTKSLYQSHIIQFYFHFVYAVTFYIFLFVYALVIIILRFKKFKLDKSLLTYHAALVLIFIFSIFR